MAVSVSLLVVAMQSLVKSPWSYQENENVNKHNWQKGRTPSSEGDRVKQRQAEQPLNGPSEQIMLLLTAVSKVKIEFSISVWKDSGLKIHFIISDADTFKFECK